MRSVLSKWIADTDARVSEESFGLDLSADYSYVAERHVDLYYSLVGELFKYLRDRSADPRDWASLGDALVAVSRYFAGEARSDALFFASCAFYSGGFPASACITMRQAEPNEWTDDKYRACYDLLARPREISSVEVRGVIGALRRGDAGAIDAATSAAATDAAASLTLGPEAWVPRHVFSALLTQFSSVNLRNVLPSGWEHGWDPLVRSFLNRPQPVWEFFPSQIEAISKGLLVDEATFSLQMPTGAGKTALTETLIFSHLLSVGDGLAVLLVPYRALARELRYSVARRLARAGLATRTVYGGTVPSAEESEDLDSVKVIIATPESLTGLLGANPELHARISLVVCDEGHLLDSDGRGIGLELLLARFRTREPALRLVFLSAIVPNIEEINTWLGGNAGTVVRSEFRPAQVEYAVLRPRQSTRVVPLDLHVQATGSVPDAYTLAGLLDREDFVYVKAETGRRNTYPATSIKTRAVAAARKALALGPVAVFAANKTGNQGVIGLVEEVLRQLAIGLRLPVPRAYVANEAELRAAVDYLAREYGANWVGTQGLSVGVVMHHGDLLQETREVLEDLVAVRTVQMVVCTSTLAEGVNLPIRTLILYSVRRTGVSGRSVPMLSRDIKNLVGRAGRAGSSTRGLVICANPNQWEDVLPVALDRPGERVAGALVKLVSQLQRAVKGLTAPLSNEDLESTPQLFSLVDGVDSMLLELLHDEIGPDEFRELALALAGSTYAATQVDDEQRELLRAVFELRAEMLAGLRSRGQLAWVRASGARPRLVRPVASGLVPRLQSLLYVESPLDPALMNVMVDWAYAQPGFADRVQDAFRSDATPEPATLARLVSAWLRGETFHEMAEQLQLDVNDCLRAHAQLVGYDFLSLVEQAIALLESIAGQSLMELPESVKLLPQCIRFGVSTAAAVDLLAGGVRHRRAAITLAALLEAVSSAPAMTLMREFEVPLRESLGDLVYERTLDDLREPETSDSAATGNPAE